MSLYCKFESHSAWPERNRKPNFSESSIWCCWCHHTANVSAGTRRTNRKFQYRFEHSGIHKPNSLHSDWHESKIALKQAYRLCATRHFQQRVKLTLNAKPRWDVTQSQQTRMICCMNCMWTLRHSFVKVFLNVRTRCRDVLHLFTSASLIFNYPHT